MTSKMDSGPPLIAVAIGNKSSYKFDVNSKSIIINQGEKRDNESICSFDGEKRLFGFVASDICCTHEATTSRFLMGSLMFSKLEDKSEDVDGDDRIDDEDDLPSFKYKIDEKEYEMSPIESLSSYIKWLVSRHITEENKKVGFVIPKYFDDRAKSRVFQAAQLAGIEIMPILSTTAHVYDYYNRVSVTKETYVVLVNSGDVCTELAYWRFLPEKAELLMYHVIDVGGVDYSYALADFLLDYFLSNKEAEAEAEKIKNNVSKMRTFLNVAIDKKEGLANNIKARFESNVFESSIRKDFKGSDFISSDEVGCIHYDFLGNFISESLDKFIEEYSDVKNLQFELDGGNCNNEFVKENFSSCFKNVDIEVKATTLLSSKESIAEGAAFYFAEQDIEIIDDIHPYKVVQEGLTVYSKANEDVFTSDYTRASISSERYWKKPNLRKNTRLYELNKKVMIEEDYDENGMIIVPRNAIKTDYAHVSEEKMSEYEANLKRFDEMDERTTKLSSSQNEFQSIFYEINKLKRDRFIFKKEGKMKNLLNIYDYAQKIYSDVISRCRLRDFAKVEDSCVVLKIIISNEVSNALEKTLDTKTINKFMVAHRKLFPGWPSTDILKPFDEFNESEYDWKTIKIWNSYMKFFVDETNKENKENYDPSTDENNSYEKKDFSNLAEL